MGRTKTQRKTTLVIKTHQNNKQKKNWGGIGTYQFILVGPVLLLFVLLLKKNIFEEIGGGTMAPTGPPPSVSKYIYHFSIFFFSSF
jgi:hypothetical protein